MPDSNTLQRSFSSKIIFVFSIVVSLYWLAGNFFNIYIYKLPGIIYEILWLPMLVLLFAVPVIAVISWAKNQFKLNSLYPFALFIIAATVAILIIKK